MILAKLHYILFQPNLFFTKNVLRLDDKNISFEISEKIYFFFMNLDLIVFRWGLGALNI